MSLQPHPMPYTRSLERKLSMPAVSLTRLYALRAMYLILFVLVPLMTAAGIVYSARSVSAADGGGPGESLEGIKRFGR